MPLYQYACPACGREAAAYRHVDQRHDGPDCCGKGMEKVLIPPTVRPDIQPYQSPIDGRCVGSRRERIEDLKRNGCRPWEGMEAEKQHAASCLASDEAVSDRKLAAATADVLNNMSAASQRVLNSV